MNFHEEILTDGTRTYYQQGFPRPNARSTLDSQQHALRASILSAICCCATVYQTEF